MSKHIFSSWNNMQAILPPFRLSKYTLLPFNCAVVLKSHLICTPGVTYVYDEPLMALR